MKKIPSAPVVFVFSSLSLASAQPVTASPYSDMKDHIKDLLRQYPTTTRPISLGISDSGDEIQGLAIGDGPIKNLVVATHHGNEYGSTEVAKAFADSVAKDPIPNQTLFVIPVLNIDGYNQGNREEVANGSSHDPNRDYPGPCGTDGPHKLKSTQALAQFVDQQGIVSSATLHTFYPAVVYPWGLATHDLDTPYLDLFKQLTAAATQESHYETGNSSQVIYPANGTFEDYAYWKHGIWSLLFELGHSHSPDDADVQELVRLNVPGLRSLFEKSPTQRAEKHAFTGKCDYQLLSRDRHDE